MSIDLYTTITDRIIEMLEKGVAPWRSPILAQAASGWPKNLERNQPYRGVNVFLLAFTAWERGYGSSYWLTFRQAKVRGGSVKKGEKASMVVFWKPYETIDKATGKVVTLPLLRFYLVFNLDQCDGIVAPDNAAIPEREHTPLEAADQMIRGYSGGPELFHLGSKAYYRPGADAVCLPKPGSFSTGEGYFATLFHELAHSTGHSSRLDRGLDTKLAPFGSPDYSKEELVAEMAAAFLCGHAGIIPATLENSAAYLNGWTKALKGDKRLVIAAAGAAQRAADWILGIRALAD